MSPITEPPVPGKPPKKGVYFLKTMQEVHKHNWGQVKIHLTS
jgi:hypothetical protein